jgi:hypothetical protein
MYTSTQAKRLLLVIAALLMTVSSIAEARSDNRSKNKHFRNGNSNHHSSYDRHKHTRHHSNRRGARENRYSYRHYDYGGHGASRYNYNFGHRKSFLPAGFLALTFAGLNYYYNSGLFYQRVGHEYAVIRPPLGVGISILPAGYRTIYRDRNRFYTANGIFYSWDENRRNYIVVNNPDTLALSTSASKNISEQYVYPVLGQNDMQTSKDRYECYLWATDQTGVEPAQIANQQNLNDLENYQRANGACLEARGYSVK